ncbi:MAG: lipoprotein insertase outer membrane protein LolB [Thiobacillus sp.]|nr:lipoprotein insertase outer membrane protein LolB [Thiobacillus sp.]
MRRSFVAWLPAVLLAACAAVPAPSVEPAAALATHWTFAGRIGIRTDAENLAGNLRWQHRPDSDVLVLSAPLGQGVARIERTPAGVTLEAPNQPLRTAPDTETLTREALGYALPLAGLAWWVQAAPDPARPSEATRNAAGQIERLQQDGWTIDYRQYVENRPRKLTLSREGLEIRLVADEWLTE